MNSYQQKLRHPKWQKKRLEILEIANWKCATCGTDDKELHVHHLSYQYGKDPWDYPNENFLAVCKTCHEERIHKDDELYRDLPDLTKYRVYSFQHVDDYRCFQPLERYLEELNICSSPSEQFLKLLVSELRKRLEILFKENGWEGDGEIECVFLPPFFVNNGYSWCETVFHVKQANNGTSFYACSRNFILQHNRQ